MFSVQGLFFLTNMGLLRLYRKFYCVSTSGSEDSYTLITPTSVTAQSFVAGTGGTESTTMIETGIPLTEEETGIFYADLNPQLYSSDVTYDLVFYVQYTPIAPVDKKILSRFRIKTYNISSEFEVELIDNSGTSIEILDGNGNVIDVQIQNNEINLDLSSNNIEYYNNENNNDIEIN